jgi:hypothetical protein
MFYAIDDFGLELALLERGSSRRTTVMRYPTREYQSDSSSLPLGRSDDRVKTKGGGFRRRPQGS